MNAERASTLIRTGMFVFDPEGDNVGTVKEVRAEDFLIDRPLARDVYVPFSAVRSVADGLVMLDIPSYKIDSQRWPNPS